LDTVLYKDLPLFICLTDCVDCACT